MKRDISQITNQIDTLAKQGCRLLTDEEKEEFFNTTKVKRHYIKGRNRGKERDIYEVDGRCFNRIWKLVYPYVLTSCAKSVYYNSFELEEAISEVRYNLFSILQRFGPVFYGKTLSQRLSIIVNISLTNNNRKITKRVDTVSMSSFEENNNDDRVFDFEDTENRVEFSDIYIDIPSNLQESIINITNGGGINKKTEKEIRTFIQNY